MEYLAIQLLRATARLLVTLDEFFIFSLLVLLKEMSTRGESKILSSWKGESKVTLYNPSGERLHVGPCSSYSNWTESHSESCQRPTMELSCNKTNNFNTLIISAKKHHHRCLTGLRMCLRLKLMSKWGVGGL